MAEIYVDQTAPIKTKIFWGGNIIDADGDVTAIVYDITEDPTAAPLVNPTTAVYTATATKSEVDAGTYQIILPLGLVRRNKKFKIQWNYQISTISGSHFSYIDVVTPYASMFDIMDDLGYGTDPGDINAKTYHDLQMAEKWARKIIENYTGQTFYLYDDVHVVYGDGSDSLRLQFKINTLHELYENDVLIIDAINNENNWIYDTQISESGFGIRINRSNLLDNTVYSANGLVPPSYNDTFGGAFKKDYVYKVQGRYGWDSIPDEVEEATIHLIKDYFSKDRAWRNKYIQNVQSFDWQFEYNNDSYRGTGNLYVDQILSSYVLTQMVVI
jgi:hypothetical protein